MPNAKIKGPAPANVKCSYGCGQVAKVEFENGNYCCEEKNTSCPAIKKKNSKRMKQLHEEGVVFYRGPMSEKEKQKVGQAVKDTCLKRLFDTEWNELSNVQKKRRVRIEQDEHCLHCGLGEWLGQPIVLELDHIDGNKENNERENLRALCPNCHSLTPTWRKRKSSLRVAEGN